MLRLPAMFAGCRRAAAVTTVVFAGCTSSPEVVLAPSSPVSTTAPTESFGIKDLKILEPDWRADGSNWRLTLSWLPPADLVIDHYEVARDGVTIDDAVGSTTFRDNGVEPGARYRYSVIGLDAVGHATQAVVDSIKTGEPSLAEARLEGSFAVRMTVDRASGTKNPVRGGAIFFSFDPTCSSGACSVRWEVRNSRTSGVLRRDDAAYIASLRTPFFVRNCFGRLTDEALDVRLHVSAAAPLRHRWRATKIEGSIEEVSSHRRCVTASIDWDVHGALQN